MDGTDVPRSRRPYSEGHLRLEKALGWLYVGSWPARVWGLFPAGRRVRLMQEHVAV